MRISELIKELEEIKSRNGDLDVMIPWADDRDYRGCDTIQRVVVSEDDNKPIVFMNNY